MDVDTGRQCRRRTWCAVYETDHTNHSDLSDAVGRHASTNDGPPAYAVVGSSMRRLPLPRASPTGNVAQRRPFGRWFDHMGGLDCQSLTAIGRHGTSGIRLGSAPPSARAAQESASLTGIKVTETWCEGWDKSGRCRGTCPAPRLHHRRGLGGQQRDKWRLLQGFLQ